MSELRSETIIPGVNPWSAEAPSLYTLTIHLNDPADPGSAQFIRKQIGFRSVKIQDSQLLVNGKAVYH